MTELTTLDDIRAALECVRQITRPTTTVYLDWLSTALSRPVYCKPEHLQRTGSFKIRGSYNHIAQLEGNDQVVAASAGNHAQGVALAATQLGRKATLFMPTTASIPKVEATKKYGGVVRLDATSVDDAIQLARQYAAATGAHFVPPFDDAKVIAGQATAGLEILDELFSLDPTTLDALQYVLVPVGGGGLLSGIAAAIKQMKPQVKMIGVEAEGAASMIASLKVGHPKYLENISTIADGIAVRQPGDLAFAHFQAFVDDVITVSDDEISRAVVLMLERSKQVVEPAGVVGIAALLSEKIPGNGPVVAVSSGGNIDPMLLMKIVEQGLSAAGRYAVIRVVLVDRPGQLFEFAKAISDLGLNVIEIDYHRRGLNLSMNEVEMRITVETHGPEHVVAIVPELREKGFKVYDFYGPDE